MGTFKGIRNEKGRKKGSVNKTTALSRQIFNDILSENIHTIQNDLDSLKPLDRLKIILELSQFCVPKLRSVEMSDLTNQFKPIVINLTDHEN